MNKTRLKLIVIAVSALVVELAVPVFSGIAHAAPPPQFTSAFVRLDRVEALTPTGGLVCVTTNTMVISPLLGTEADVAITFPTQSTGTDFVVNATAAHWTVSSSANLYGTSSVWPGIGTATNVTGKTVTFPSTALSPSTTYCFTFAAASTLTTGSVSSATDELDGDIETDSATPAIIDQTNFAVPVINNDQVVVSAIVPPRFDFSLSGNTDAFVTDLNPFAITATTGVSYSIVTNAKGGWIAWVEDSQAGLFSPTANHTIPSVTYNSDAPTVLVANHLNEAYGLFDTITATSGGGCTAASDPEYTQSGGSASAEVGQLSKTGYLPNATCTGAAPATDNGTTVLLQEQAVIAGGTPAGSDYGDIITVTAAGNF